ncbi:MAG TPA: aminotransferase class V-fold PLP-dependent enzyme, partial [Acidimicrobiales bacterium]|nr:aminotransferase class V-fold PLP-dependent enzyme [Acidimicrobiales bacterium]
DAVQAAAWLDLSDVASGADLVSVSSHKWGGPQGAGGLAIRHGVSIRPLLHGGGQEREMRSGTHNVAAIVGFAAAAWSSAQSRESTSDRVRALRDDLARRIITGIPQAIETSAGAARVPGHLHLRIPGVESEALLVLLDDLGICASAGAACASGALEPSPVLLAMGVDKDEALCSLRLTLGPTTTADDIQTAANGVVTSVRRLGGS